MIKKLAISALMLMIILSIFGFAGCDNDDLEDNIEKFYSLDVAFDNEWLTVDELKSIAYYYYEEGIFHDHADCKPFTPILKNPITLDDEIQAAIKQTYLVELKERAPDATIDNVQIANYLGTYNGCVVVGVTDDYFGYDYLFEPEYYIGGVMFRSYCAKFAQVWRSK